MGKLIKYISILIVIVLLLSACGKAVIKMKGKMLLKQKPQNIKVVP